MSYGKLHEYNASKAPLEVEMRKELVGKFGRGGKGERRGCGMYRVCELRKTPSESGTGFWSIQADSVVEWFQRV